MAHTIRAWGVLDRMPPSSSPSSVPPPKPTLQELRAAMSSSMAQVAQQSKSARKSPDMALHGVRAALFALTKHHRLRAPDPGSFTDSGASQDCAGACTVAPLVQGVLRHLAGKVSCSLCVRRAAHTSFRCDQHGDQHAYSNRVPCHH